MRTSATLRSLHAIVLAGLVTTLAGCAHARPAGSLFVTGSPSSTELRANLGAAAPAAPEHGPEVREQRTAHEVPQRLTQARTVEDTDPSLRRALAELARRPGAASQYAVALQYMRLGIYDQALEHVESMIDLDPRAGCAWDLRARVWRDWGLPGLALPDAYRAAGYAPRDAAVHNTLATILVALGQPAAARRELLTASDLDPGAVWVRENLCRLSSMAGDRPDAALSWCEPRSTAKPEPTGDRPGNAAPTR